MKAFPTTYRNYDDSISHDCTGMELRDYFAAKAIPSLVKTFENNITTPDDVAKLAYKYADAMMKARETNV